MVKQYGGTFLARGGAFELLDGEGRGRNVVIEFASVEAARTFYHSPEYAAARRIRNSASAGDFILVTGVEA